MKRAKLEQPSDVTIFFFSILALFFNDRFLLDNCCNNEVRGGEKKTVMTPRWLLNKTIVLDK